MDITGSSPLALVSCFLRTGEKAFHFAAPSAWNSLQDELKLSNLIPFDNFVKILKIKEDESIGRESIKSILDNFILNYLIYCYLPVSLLVIVILLPLGQVTFEKEILYSNKLYLVKLRLN